MSRYLEIPLSLDDRRTVAGVTSSTALEIELYQNDTYRVRLRGLRKSTASFGDLFTKSAIDYASLAIGIFAGGPDAPPTDGTFKLKVGDTWTTGALSWNIGKGELQVALNALAGVSSAGGVVVNTTGANNFYTIQWNTPANALSIVGVENKLQPLCLVRATENASLAGQVLLKVFRAPLAFTDQFESPLPPESTIGMVRGGTSLRNEIQVLTIPPEAVGEFAFVWGGQTSEALAVTATATEIAAVLNAFYTDTPTARFQVTSSVTGRFAIEFVGSLAKADQPLLELELYGQTPLDTPEATFAITQEVPVDLQLQGAARIPVVLEIASFDEAGEKTVLAQQTIYLINNGIDNATAAEIAPYQRTVTEYVYPEFDAAAIIGQRSASVVLPGSGTGEVETGSYNPVFTHNLNTLTPIVSAFRLVEAGVTSASDEWQSIPSNEYDCRSEGSANAVVVRFPYTPPEYPVVGSVRIYATNLDAQVYNNEHEHPTSRIFEEDGDGVKTYLNDILTTLRNAMPDGWPNVPGSVLTSGSVTADKLDLASVVAALKADAGFLAALRELVKDKALIEALLTALTTDATLGDVFKTFVAAVLQLIKDTESLRTSFAELLQIQEVFDILRGLLLAALQGGNSLPSGNVIFEIADIDETFPPVNKLGGVVIYPPLPIALMDYGASADIVGELPATGTAGTRYHCTGDTWSAQKQGRARKRFYSGDYIIYHGGMWLKTTEDTNGALYPTEMERTLAQFHVSSAMLRNETRLLLAIRPWLQLRGNAVGRCAIVFEAGAYSAEASEPLNLTGLTWTALHAENLELGPAGVSHELALTIARDDVGVLSGTINRYGKTTDLVVLPAAADFALRARLIRFDVEDIAAPKGALTLKLNGVAATIIPVD